jgi:hypothetical protein
MKEFPKEGKCKFNDEIYRYLKRTRKFDSNGCFYAPKYLSWNDKTVRWIFDISRVNKPMYTPEELLDIINGKEEQRLLPEHIKVGTVYYRKGYCTKDNPRTIIKIEGDKFYYSERSNNYNEMYDLKKNDFYLVSLPNDNKPMEELLKLEDLVEGEIYSSINNDGLYVFKCRESKSNKYSYRIESTSFERNYCFGRNRTIEQNLKLATPEEKQWLETCIAADKFIPKEQALKTKSLVGRYIKALVDQPYCIARAKKGDYFIILDNFNLCKLVKDGSTWSYKENNGTIDFKIWELMPPDFNPHIVEQPEVEKPKFEVGKWYKVETGYKKFHHLKDNRFYFSEDIYQSEYKTYSRQDWCDYIRYEYQLLTDLSEIQQYLPDNHPDKIKVDVIPEYVELLNAKFEQSQKELFSLSDIKPSHYSCSETLETDSQVNGLISSISPPNKYIKVFISKKIERKTIKKTPILNLIKKQKIQNLCQK